MTTQSTLVTIGTSTVDVVQVPTSATNKKANSLKRLTTMKVKERLGVLDREVEQLTQDFDEIRNRERIQDLVSEKLDDLAYSMQGDAESPLSDDGDGVTSRIDTCMEVVKPVGLDVEEVSGECAELMRKVSKLEEDLDALISASLVRKARSELETVCYSHSMNCLQSHFSYCNCPFFIQMKQEYQNLRVQNDRTSALLEEQKQQLADLKALAASFQGASSNITTFPTHEEILEAILPSVREQMRNDITAVAEGTKKMVHTHIEEQSKVYGDLWSTIEPILQAARLERKGMIQRPRAASPHTSSGDAKLGAYTHSNHT